MVEIPQDIVQDAAQAAIWAELVADDSRFTEQDVPALRLLCFWHAVAMEALEDKILSAMPTDGTLGHVVITRHRTEVD